MSLPPVFRDLVARVRAAVDPSCEVHVAGPYTFDQVKVIHLHLVSGPLRLDARVLRVGEDADPTTAQLEATAEREFEVLGRLIEQARREVQREEAPSPDPSPAGTVPLAGSD